MYENVVEATRATLKQALKDAPAFTNQVFAVPSMLEYTLQSTYDNRNDLVSVNTTKGQTNMFINPALAV